MLRKRHKPEEIVAKLRQMPLLVASTLEVVRRQVGGEMGKGWA